MGEAEIGPHYPDPPAEAPGLAIAGFGVREQMRPRVVERPDGTADTLIAVFHQDAVVDAGGRHPGPLAMAWAEGAPQRYGDPEADWLHSWIHCRGPAVEALLAREGVPRDRPLPGFDPQPFEHLLRLLHSECTAPTQPDPAILLDIIGLIARLLGRHQRDLGAARVPEELARLRFRLEREPGRDWTVAEMAASCGWSTAHFSRQFAAAFGMPPMECLIRMRLRRARHLLADHRRSVGAVAAEVGYPEIAYFSRLFRSRYGIPPSSARRLRDSKGEIIALE